MAWEMQKHMIEYIRPSIDKALDDVESDIHGFLEDEEFCNLSRNEQIDRLAHEAIENATTTNGAHEFYVDDWTTIPWCSEEEMIEFWSY